MQRGKLRLRILGKGTFRFAIVLAASFSANFFNTCSAQTDVQPKWTGSTTTKVKPEMRRNFERYLKQLVAAYKKAGTLSFLTLETFAGDTTEYTTVVPVMKFGDLDNPSPLVRVLGAAGWERLSRSSLGCHLKTGQLWSLQNRPVVSVKSRQNSYTLPTGVPASFFDSGNIVRIRNPRFGLD